VSEAASLTWLARHEFRLGWRDWVSLVTAGGRTRARNAIIGLIAFAAFMHVFAYWTVANYADATLSFDTAALVGITGTLVLSWSLLLSQAMESVTRAFYSRSDLDLILTSPASARKVFAVRMGRIAAAAVVIAVLLAAPFVNVLAVLGGGRWLAAYGVVAAMGAVATAAALALTIGLFRVVGAKRTRLIAQVVAAIIGAAFVIGLQIAAIFSAGSISRFAALQSDWMLMHAPNTASAFWWPARAVLGDFVALAGVVAFGVGILCVSIALFCRRFGGACRCGRRRFQRDRAPTPLVARLSPPLAEPRVAAEGMDTAAARCLAHLADTDADPLSASARAAAVGHVSRWSRFICGPDPGDSDGRRAARWRARLVVDFGRGRAGTRRHGADHRSPRPVGQGRSRHRHDRADFRANRGRVDA
jgi:hypothetical protein